MKNKKKKGFTLIELLAIIVILAIIAVITIPVILNIIENSKKGAIQDSAYGYKEAINKYYATKLLDDQNYRINGTYTIDENGQMIKGNETIIIPINGQKPVGGELTYELQKITSGCLTIDGYKVIWNDNIINRVEKGTCYEETNITFDLNYDNQTNVQTKNKDRKIGELPQPTRSGYTLEGWFTESTGGRQITADEMVTGATTYYAHWTQNAVSVVFDGNGGNTPAQTIVASGSTYYEEHGQLLPTPTREGYDFLGWFTQVEDGTQVYGNEILTTDEATSVTYHAHWIEKSLVSLYYSNGIRKIPTRKTDFAVGDRITIQDEGFRVINNNNGNLTLLAEYNIREEYYEDGYGYIPNNNNGIALMTNKTYLADSGYRYKQEPGNDYYCTSFASENSWYGREWNGNWCEEGDSPQYDDGWKYCIATDGGYAYASQPGMKVSEEEMSLGYDDVKEYLRQYKDYLNYSILGNSYIETARLLTYEEAWAFRNAEHTMLSNGQAYWLGSAYGEGEDGLDGVYVVDYDYTDNTNYYNDTSRSGRDIGVRPVIEVNGSDLFQTVH